MITSIGALKTFDKIKYFFVIRGEKNSTDQAQCLTLVISGRDQEDHGLRPAKAKS
jgi:hypothetical protein